MSALPIKIQFSLAYGVMGSISPIAAILLRDAKGFTPQQFGFALAIASIGLLFSPAIVTWLADREFDTRSILRAAYFLTAISLSAVLYAQSIWVITAAWAFYSIAFLPVLPLLDGYYFNEERRGSVGSGGAEGAYQFVRVWGTIGFLIPSLVLYFAIARSGNIAAALWVAIAWCGLGFAGTFALKPSLGAQDLPSKAPTLSAARILMSRSTLPLCIGIAFALTSATAYYPVLSVFLTDSVGIADKWVALVLSLGVAIEIAYIFGLGPLRRWLGIRGLLVVGLGAMSLRLIILAVFPTVTTALAIQLLHGIEILAVFLVPITYLNSVASDGFRNSIQGVFTVLVVVPTRFIGPLLAGWIREIADTATVLYTAAGLSGIGMLILFFFFKPTPTENAP